MAKYFSHKPQYRRGTTPRPAPVLEFNRDFRSGDFEFSGPVYQPDPRSSSGRVPSVPRKQGRSWSSPVNFSPRPGFDRAAKRVFWRNVGRGVGGVFRGANFAMDLWDMYDDVSRSLGGDPYTNGSSEPFMGGPDEYPHNTVPNPDGGFETFPAPSDHPGWNLSVSKPRYNPYTLRGHGSLGSSQRWLRPFPTPYVGGWHRPFPNPSASYSPATVIGWGAPPSVSPVGGNLRYAVSNNAQDGGWWSSGTTTPVWDSVRNPSLSWTLTLPPSAPAPVLVDGFPRSIHTPNGTPEEIRDGWPMVDTRLNTLLPSEAWGPGVAWWRIPGRNRLRATDPTIRTESNGPPLNPDKGPGVIHKPPGPGVTESKRRTNSAAVLWWYRAAKKSWHEVGEYCDRIDAIYEALPKDARLKYRPGSPINCAEKTGVILRNLHRLDMNEAIKNLVVNEIEDRIIGAGFKSLDDAARKLGIPGWRVDLGMQGNVETAIEFLFEIKKALSP